MEIISKGTDMVLAPFPIAPCWMCMRMRMRRVSRKGRPGGATVNLINPFPFLPEGGGESKAIPPIPRPLISDLFPHMDAAP